jgi:membrane associated rhomboid family serine protease
MDNRGYRNSYQGFSLGALATLIITNIVVFIGTSINPHLVDLFGFQPSNFLSAPWTLLTAMFIHGGLTHILGNMITLFFFGQFLIDLIGDRNFLITYFAGGILGNIFYLFLGDPNSIAIGASGAVFAVGGALTVLRPNLKVFIFPIPLPISIWIAVIGGFIIMTQPGVAWQAHLGGLVFGLIMGWYLRGPHRFLPQRSRSVFWRGREIQY